MCDCLLRREKIFHRNTDDAHRGKNDFAQVSKNLATEFGYRFENNYAELSIMLVTKMSKLFAILLCFRRLI